MVMNKIAEDGHDYVALSWVKAEIVNNLDQAQKALELLASDSASTEDVSFGLANCYELLHQVSGALHMVGFPGAALFAEEIKTLCKKLINNKVDNFNHSLQILMQAILQMLPYLEIIQTEGHDIPIALLPLINEMRACYEADPLSEVELFSPKYYGESSPLTDEELKEINTEGLTNLLRKLRQSLQLSLIDLIHNRNFELALDHLVKIFNYLGRLCKATSISMLWRISQAFVVGINEKNIPNNSEVKSLLKQIDLQIRMLVEQGVTGMNNPAPESLIKELLFLLTTIDSNSDEIIKIKKEFHLSSLISNAQEINTQQAKFSTIDRAALESVILALEEEFVFVKDRLDLFARSENKDESDLKELPKTLKRVSNTLDILGLDNQKIIVNKQEEVISSALANQSFDKTQAIDVAEALLSVENVIKNITNNNELSTTDISGARDVVIKEATVELAKVKEILALYFSSNGKEGIVTDAVELLTHTAGALYIISQQRAAAVVVRCLQYIEERLINDSVYPDNKEIDSIVGAIASIDYYMECFAKNQIVSAKDALNFAVKYLIELSYPLPEDYESLASKFVSSTNSEKVKEDEVSDVDVDSTENISKAIIVDALEPKAPASKLSDDDTEVDEELVEIFSEEMGEILETLATKLPALIADTDDIDSLIEIRRSFHTIKGSGRMVKAVVIGELGWAIENMLNRVLDKAIPVTQSVLDLVQNVVALLPCLVKEYAAGKQYESDKVKYYSATAHAISNKEEPPVYPSLESLNQKINDEAEVSIDNISTELEEIVSDDLEINATESEVTSYSPIESIDRMLADNIEEFDVELIDIFIAEARTHIHALKIFIAQCERSLPQVVTDSLQRAMHTLKGSALMASLDSIVRITKPFESFLKECSINAWPIERTDLELLQDAYALLNAGIRQLELYSLAAVDGTDSLVERIRLRRDYLLSQLEVNVTSELLNVNSEASPAELASELMLQVDLILDAEDYIKKWQNNPKENFAQQQGLQEELTKISLLTKQAGFNAINDLSSLLLKAYDSVLANTVKRDDLFFTALTRVHHVLLNCIDQLAAAQVISEYPEEMAKLEDVLSCHSDLEISETENSFIKQDFIELDEKIKSIEEGATAKVVHEVKEFKPTSEDNKPEIIFTTEDKLILGAPVPAGPMIGSGDDIDFDMAEIFLEEADDIVDEARKDLDKWIEDKNPDHLKDLQRQLHTLKGGARMCGAGVLGDISHGLEFIYEGLLSGHYSYSSDLAKLLNKSHDFIQVIIDTLHSTTNLPNNPELLNAIQVFRQDGRVILDNLSIKDIIENVIVEPVIEISAPKAVDFVIEELLPEEELPNEVVMPAEAIENAEATEPTSVFDEIVSQSDIVETTVAIEPTVLWEEPVSPVGVEFKHTEIIKSKEKLSKKVNRDAAEQIKVSAELLDNLVNLAGETSIYRSRLEQQNTDLATVLVEVDATVERVRDQLRRLDMETQSQIISKHQTETSSSYADFDPLEMDQYSQLQQLSRSLFESASDLQDLKDTLKRRNSDVDTLLQQQGRINTELQEGLMRTRMVPLDRIAPRLRRLVRQVSAELKKDVDLVIGNTAGEMDRGVIDAIVAPLEHMIRNSIDHGVESTDIRLSAGKPAKGTIYLDLIREGGEMVLRLKDDGAGISARTVREKAISKGLISSDEDLSDTEVLQFILEAGFSTAKKITQISGRGVGLDVVVNAVKQLGGVLSLDSKEGRGTTFSIRLPINLSVSRALMIRVGDDSYAIPMSTVEGVTYISQEQQKEFYQFGTAELEYGGDAYRIKYLGELLGNQIPIQTHQTLEEKASVLLVRSGEHYMALRVDELLPSSEVVVKSLGVQFLSVPAISGATILGDGSVIIILDLSALVRSYFLNQQHQLTADERRIATVDEVVEAKRPPLVMVVDDSVTVRKVTTRLLERQGMEVITARDGLDAVTQLEERTPDIMLLDIEMPRMDGFEVATRVRHDERTKNLPIIMITSRSGDKHRERALAIGVNEYMSKPFMEARLVKSISDLLPTFEVNLLESSS